VPGPGAVGSAGSLSLRVGQAVSSSASLLFMSVGVEFFSYAAFWYLSPLIAFSVWGSPLIGFSTLLTCVT
jgi:hypothetical protein